MTKSIAAAEPRTVAGSLADSAAGLSLRQERVLFLHELHQDKPVCTIGELMLVTGELRLEQLRDAFVALAERHEVLRWVVATEDGHRTTAVGPVRQISFTVDTQPTPDTQPAPPDLAGDSETERSPRGDHQRQAIQHWAQTRRCEPFDLQHGPLWRVHVWSFGPAEHALLLLAHELIADRRSLRIMLEDVAHLYSAVIEGRRADLPPAPAYRDIAELRRQRLANPAFAAMLDARLATLADLPAGLELPADRRRPPALSFSGARVSGDLDSVLAKRVESLARAHGSPVRAVLLAAFVLLVHRYTGVRDVVLGVPVDDSARGVGPLANVLVLRIDLSDDPAFRVVLDRAQQALAAATEPHDVPFELLIEQLRAERDLSQRPVCQIAFECRPAPSWGLRATTSSALPLEQVTAAFDLALVTGSEETGSEETGPEGTGFAFEYDTDLFDRATVTRLAENFQILLASVLAQPQERVSRHQLLSPGERQALVTDWNDTRVEFPRHRLVHQLIADQAVRRPQATALVAGEHRMTYRELNGRANQLAHQLRGLAVGPEVPVGVLLGRSIDMVVAALGVLKAGGAVLLLDPAQPIQRLGYMLADSQAPVLLTSEALLAQLPSDYHGAVCCLDRDQDLLAQADDTDPEQPVHGEGLCQIAYTSGSTGAPRGVAFRHGAVLLVSYGTQRAYSLTEADRGSWISAPGFGISFVNELWPFLTIGAAVHIADDTVVSSPFRLRDWMLSNEITVSLLTKVLADRVCAVDWPRTTPLRVLMVSGERVGALPSSLPFEIVTIYGSTETTNASTCFNEADGVRLTPKSVPPLRRDRYSSPVGRPVPNARVYLLDEHLELVPIGVIGQIYVGGELLQRGYLNQPDATAQKWWPDPFADRPGARMVGTGDVGRILADGTIDVLGRVDDQVSLNGYRIELGEITSRILEHTAVRQAAVVIREDETGQRRLVAYLVAAAPHLPSQSELRELLKEQLPAYMVPSAFIVLDSLPLLPNGKLDGKALLAIDLDAPRAAHGDYLAPRTAVEQTLVDVWQRVLRQEQVGVRDNYFELGGDSLTGMELMASIGVTLGVDLPLRTLFDAPTVEDMAAAVERMGEQRR